MPRKRRNKLLLLKRVAEEDIKASADGNFGSKEQMNSFDTDIDMASDDTVYVENKSEDGNAYLRSGDTLIERLVYPKILERIDEISHEGALGLSRVSKTDDTNLPRIIVIGDESAGKSSTLERIAMADVLPRNPNICTRQPILLKLRQDVRYKHNKPSIQVSIPDFKNDLNPSYETSDNDLDYERVREMIQNHMDSFRGDEVAILDEIIVEIRSDGVPSIDLVDLPGLVAVTDNQHQWQVTEQYLKKPTTGVVICVIDAGMGNLRASNAIKILQEAPSSIQENAIGVFAKSDKAFDLDWKDQEDKNGECCKPGKMWKLEERLLGTADDYNDTDEPYLGVKRGFVAVVNRNTKSRSQKTLSLSDQNNNEINWFVSSFLNEKERTPQTDTEILKNVGLDALIRKMDTVLCEQLGKDWIPKRLEEIEKKREEIQQKIDLLGTDPKKLSVEVLSKFLETKLKVIFPKKSQEICEEVLESVLPFPIESVDESSYDCTLKAGDFREKVDKVIRTGQIYERIIDNTRDAIKLCFENDTQGSIQLHRFGVIKDVFIGSLTSIATEHHKKLAIALTESSEVFFMLCRREPFSYLSRDILKYSLSRCVHEFLTIPLFHVQDKLMPVVQLSAEKIEEIPGETCAPIRDKYEGSLQQLDEIEGHYNYLMEPHNDYIDRS